MMQNNQQVITNSQEITELLCMDLECECVARDSQCKERQFTELVEFISNSIFVNAEDLAEALLDKYKMEVR